MSSSDLPAPGGGNTLVIAVDSTRAVSSVNRLSDAFGTIDNRARRATEEIVQYERAVDGAGIQVDDLTKLLAKLAAAYAGFQGLKQAVTNMASFEQAVANIAASSHNGAESFELISNSLKELNLTTRFSLNEIETALLKITRAGFTLEDSLKILPQSLTLAAASFGDVAVSADTTSDVIKSFNLSVDDSSRVVDVLGKLANTTAADVVEIKDAIATVAPVANQFGVSLEEVAAGIATLTERGIRARIGGLGLKEMLIQLGPAMDKANPQRVGLLTALEKLADRQFTASEQTAIFSKEVVQVTSTLLNNVARYRELVEASKEVGSAHEIVNAQNQTLEFGFKQVGAAVQELFLNYAEHLVPSTKDFLKNLKDAVLILAGNDEAMRNASESANKLARAFAIAFDVAIIVAVVAITDAIAGMIAALIAATGPIGALAVAFTLLLTYLTNTEESVNNVDKSFRNLHDTVVDLKLVPVSIDADIQKITKLTAEINLARDTAAKREAVNAKMAQLEALKHELELLSDEGRYASTSILELAHAFRIDPNDIAQLESVQNILRGLKLANFAPDTPDSAFFNTKDVVPTEGIMAVVKQEIYRLNDMIEKDPTLKIDVVHPDEDAAKKVTKTIDEILDKLQQRAENAGNIDVFDTYITKLKEETQKLAGDNFERAKSKALIEGENFARQHGVKFTKDQIRAIENEADAQQRLIETRKEEADYIRINREKTQEAIDLIQALRTEQEAVNLTSIERERLITIRHADAIAMKAQSDEVDELAKNIKEEADKLAKLQAGKVIADGIVDPIISGLEDAIFEFNKLNDVVKNVMESIARNILRETALEPLKKALTNLIFSIVTSAAGTSSGSRSFGGIQSNGGGGLFGPSVGVTGHAMGDTFSDGMARAFSRPTLLDSGVSGHRFLLGEKDTEGAFPLTRDSQGRLAIRGTGGGGTVINANMTVVAPDPSAFGRSQRQVMDSFRSAIRLSIR